MSGRQVTNADVARVRALRERWAVAARLSPNSRAGHEVLPKYTEALLHISARAGVCLEERSRFLVASRQVYEAVAAGLAVGDDGRVEQAREAWFRAADRWLAGLEVRF